MATTGPVGPPPRHYRPPGSPRSTHDSWTPDQPLGAARTIHGTPTTPFTPSGSGRATSSRQHSDTTWRRRTLVAAMALVIALVATAAGLALTQGDDATATTTPTSRPPGNTVPQAPAVPPSTDLPIESVGSLDAPVPVGQAYVVGLYTIEVLEVNRDAERLLLLASSANQRTSIGERAILVSVRISFTERDGLGNPTIVPFWVSDGEQQWGAYSPTCSVVPDGFSRRQVLASGDSIDGNVCFTVPVSRVNDLYLVTETFGGDLYFALPS